MTTEDRLRDALHRHTETVVTPPDGWAEIERAAAVRQRNQRVRIAAVGTLAAAAAVVVVVLAVAGGDDGRTLNVADQPDEATTTVTSEPTTTTVAVAPAPPDPASVGGIYPDADAYRTDGVDAFRDPVATATAFARRYLGMPTPAVGTFTASGPGGGRVAVRPNQRASATTTLTLAQVGTDGPWTVTAASAATIKVSAPVAGAQIGSPVRVAGSAQAFEGHVAVEIRQDGMRAGSSLGQSFVTGGGDAMVPFEGTVTFRSPAREFGAVLFMAPSAQDGTPVVATVVRVRFGGRGATTPPTTVAAATRLDGSSRLTFDGIGPVSLGMTESEARQAAGTSLRSSTFGACQSLQPESEPAGVTLVLAEGNRINVITVNSGSTATDRGVRIGSSQSDVLAAYPGAEVKNPTEARHWVFARQDQRTIVFEIENGAVFAFRTGVSEIVERDEICA